MKRTSLLRSLCLLALAVGVTAQTTKPPTKPKTEAEILQDAIDAVDAAKKKPEAKPTPATPAKPDKPAPTAPKSPNAKPSAPSNDGTMAITSEDDMEFDNKKGVITYRKNVFLDRPDVKIWCDELEVQRLPDEKPKAVNAADPVKAPPSSDEAPKIKTAVARASERGLVVIWQKTAEGEVIAHAKTATYDGLTGDIILNDRIEVLQGKNIHLVGQTESADFTLKKDGKGVGKLQTAIVGPADAKAIRARMLEPTRNRGKRPAPAPAAPTPGTTPSSTANGTTTQPNS